LPIYEYRCRKGHDFEVMQSMSDDPVEKCPECGSPVERVFRPVAVHFKGSGFYTTDYGRGRSGAATSDSGSSSSEESKGSSDSGSKKDSGSKETTSAKSGSGDSGGGSGSAGSSSSD
jgi:putative FmdB family regulatory protein